MLSLILFRYKTGSPHTRFYTQPHIQYRPPPTGIERALQEHRALLERLVLWLFSFGYTPHTHTSESLSHSLKHTHTPTHTPWKKAVTENFWKIEGKESPNGKNRISFTKQERKKKERKHLSIIGQQFSQLYCTTMPWGCCHGNAWWKECRAEVRVTQSVKRGRRFVCTGEVSPSRSVSTSLESTLLAIPCVCVCAHECVCVCAL